MENSKALNKYCFVFGSFLFVSNFANAATLSLGADYLLRGVSVTDRDKSIKSNDYYDQRLQGYLITDLSKDVEATIRIQSITPWGLEGSTNALTTRYPTANGNLWVQNAFVRLPNVWKKNLTVTAGRQPIEWGDGHILSDDDLGFNAIRAEVKSPWRALPFDADLFTAKISEGLQNPGDTDLHGAMISFDSKKYHWDLMGLMEKNDGPQNYEMGSETAAVVSSDLARNIYGVRAITRLKDAYLKGEYYFQTGSFKRPTSTVEHKLSGRAYTLGLGGKQNTDKYGRFGAVVDYSEGSGDDLKTPTEDEAFRPTFASRWSGLERKGYGHYYAATFSDVYSSSSPFASVNSANSGLPDGTSGIQSVHFGMESTPWPQWTFSLDYYQYKALKNLIGSKELGTEFDYGFVYRYSGLVTVRGVIASFTPGEAYSPDTRQKASTSNIEVEVKF